jgi:hypothetical protein
MEGTRSEVSWAGIDVDCADTSRHVVTAALALKHFRGKSPNAQVGDSASACPSECFATRS